MLTLQRVCREEGLKELVIALIEQVVKTFFLTSQQKVKMVSMAKSHTANNLKDHLFRPLLPQ